MHKIYKGHTCINYRTSEIASLKGIATCLDLTCDLLKIVDIECGSPRKF